MWIKLQSLRDQRRKMDRKIKESKKSGAGADDVVKPSVWWYDLVAFLVMEAEPNQTLDNLENCPNTCNKTQDDQSPTAELQSTPVSGTPLKRKRGSKTDLSTIAMECLQEIRKSNEAIEHTEVGSAGVDLDAEGIFGQHIAAELRKVTSEVVKQIMKSEIQNVLLRAHMGVYNGYSFPGNNESVSRSLNTWYQPPPGRNPSASMYGPAMSAPLFPPADVLPAPAVQGPFVTMLGQSVQYSTSNSSVGLTDDGASDMQCII